MQQQQIVAAAAPPPLPAAAAAAAAACVCLFVCLFVFDRMQTAQYDGGRWRCCWLC